MPDAPAHPAADAVSVLHEVFGYSAFRGLQAEVVDHVVGGGDALVLMPTGGGKSLCYQVPAIMRHRRGQGVAIVVSPLIALMHDQVGALEEAGVHAAFLNSTLVDTYFRQFNGHTQVNATDLRSLRYPGSDELVRLGERIATGLPDQNTLDSYIDEELFRMSDPTGTHDPIRTKRRVAEAIEVLRGLGLPREQQNERSALTLLALLGLAPTTPWTGATAPLLGITPIMSAIAHQYGRRYAPNTRETIRRFSVHQFIEAGLLVPNPDRPDRPVNSPNAVYQVEATALALIQTFGSEVWERNLATYLSTRETLRQRNAREREMERIPLRMPTGQEVRLSPGGQNVLVKQILEEFCSRFTPGADVIYVGDTDDKWAYFDHDALHALGVVVDEHGKMPDVIVHDTARNWLVLVEAVTSHGPVSPKRRAELQHIFSGARAGLVFVTAFLTRADMKRFLSDISWETEVWVADAPSHLIHFNGERFLGPYPREIGP